MQSPLVSVLMPAYNCENFIGESIQAVLDQTFNDFEFIIINDGSTDRTKEKILSFQDPRIRFFEKERNSGIVKTLNKGLALAKGKYILRTDADDISLSGMIAELVGFMEAHPDHIICGGNMKLIGGDKIFTYPSNNEELKVYALNSCPFSHSTVIFKKQVIDDNSLQYDEAIKDGEDYGLWSVLLPLGKFHNLENVTLLYRESPGQVTSQKIYSQTHIAAREKIFAIHASKYFKLEEEDIQRYVRFTMNKEITSLEELEKIGSLCRQILKHNLHSKLFDPFLLQQHLFIKWYWSCNGSYHLGKKVFFIYLRYLSSNSVLSKVKSIGLQFIKMARA